MSTQSKVAIAALLFAITAFAEEVKAPKLAEPSAAEKAFYGRLADVQKKLNESASYKIDAAATWKRTGGKKEVSGKAIGSLMHEAKTGSLGLMVGLPDDPKPTVFVQSDGKKLLRSMPHAQLFSIDAIRTKPLEAIQTDGVVLPAAATVGLDLFARPDIVRVLRAQTLRVEDLGAKDDAGKKTHSFRTTHADGRSRTFIFDGAAVPLPVTIRASSDVVIDETRTIRHGLDVELTWSFDPKLPAGTFDVMKMEALLLEGKSKKTDDLYEAIYESNWEQFLGKAAPAASFKTIGGESIAIADFKGKGIVVVYAWALWAAPNSDDLAGLMKFVKDYSAKGVTFVPVNVGDTAERVKAFLEAAKYAGPVALDPRGSELAKLGVQNVPSVVVIDKAGTIKAYLRGKPDTAEKLKVELDALLK